MNDCVFSPVCDGPCKCPAYLSGNADEGYELSEEYWNRAREANKPVRKWLESVYSAAVWHMVPDNEKCPNAKKLMSCQDCGILYAKPKDDSDD